MSTAGSVLVVGNRADPDAGHVGDRLAEHGFTLSRSWREDRVPSEVPPDTAMVLLLGSEWSVAAAVAPELLAAECALARSAGARSVPVLGLCYGAQVLAHAYGGRVSVAPRPEVGLVEVETVDEARVPAGPWWAFHSDVIEPPGAATLLASNGCGVQAFELPGALGVQFHPEVRPVVLEDWLRRVPVMAAAAGAPSEELVALAVRREDEIRGRAYALVDDFLERHQVARPARSG